jgi:ABC-type bacteriocin/lantibiotic exporter with double-glycine peptidase domain
VTAAKEARRSLLAPEVVQTSAMDCGPAALKCLLGGFGVQVSYGRLREACQTDVDGTSIDTLEVVAGQLGLDAEQVMIPPDHLVIPEARALPALVVVRLPNGFTHFVVVWRRHGGWVQVMDPATGRRWVRWSRLRDELFVHTFPVPAAGWREWAASDDFVRPLSRRLAALGAGREGEALLAAALADPGWLPLARLDAAVRAAEELAQARAIPRGHGARRLLRSLVDRASSETPGAGPLLPARAWSVLPGPADEDGGEQLLLRGAVLVRVRGRRSSSSESSDAVPASLELAASLAEPRPRPLIELLRLMKGDGAFRLGFLAAALAVAAGTVVFEALLFRGALGMAGRLATPEQRLGAMGLLIAFSAALLVLETGVAASLARLGRRLELTLRVRFGEKIPRLHDRYLQSRPVSDMAERSHSLHRVRTFPQVAGRLLRAVLQLAATIAAIAWLAPGAAPLALLAGTAAILLPLLLSPVMDEQEMRMRTHNGALGRFYLDALLGLAAVRAHGAEDAVRREHEGLLVEWGRAARRRLRTAAALEGVQALAGFGLAAWMLLREAGGGGDAAGALLLAYWALTLPVLGDEIALLARLYPVYRGVALRLLEPLGAPEEPWVSEDGSRSSGPARGVEVRMEGVSVVAAGHTILQSVDLDLAPGEHVAVVGRSGAGKSSLVGLLLGWHRPAEGRLLVDGKTLDAAVLDRLRGETAWLDPAVQVWNRSLLENVLYGSPDPDPLGLAGALNAAELHGVVERLPDGLQSPLGEGGGLLSGGEGQRVRLARALLRSGARLVVLDEPFRGLDRPRRRALLSRGRRLWSGATLLCVTHDVEETRAFDRVLVVEDGRVVEDGPPSALACDPESRYAALLAAEHDVRRGCWEAPGWRRMRLEDGMIATAGEEA